jgi:hypothetical protein
MPPVLDNKNLSSPSVFTPAALLREATRLLRQYLRQFFQSAKHPVARAQAVVSVTDCQLTSVAAKPF